MFNEIKKDVEEKAKESYHNYKYLQCLEKEFNMLGDETKELTEVVDEFVPIFHIIREIWRDNEYYKKPERLIVLIRKICNAIIAKGQEFIHSNIFNKILDDPEKEIQVLEQTREIIQKFMTAYFQYKDIEDDGWKITRNVIFYRLDAFNDRVGDILNVARSYNEFSKMSTKTIGGIKGEALGQSLLDIYNE
jgi:hypothetical protein